MLHLPVLREVVGLLVEFIGSSLGLFLGQGKLLRKGVQLVLEVGKCLARKIMENFAELPWTSSRLSVILEPDPPVPDIRVLIV